MAGGPIDESMYKFTGIQKYFNSYTVKGRLNWVLATYGTIFAVYLFRKGTKSNSKSIK